MKLPNFKYLCPSTLAEAVALLTKSDGDAKVLAGGQSLLPMMAFRVAQKIEDLGRVEVRPDGTRIGALDDAKLALPQPLLVAAISHLAHYQIRNRGTVGGSIAHARSGG